MNKKTVLIFIAVFILSNILIITPSERITAGSYNGQDLAYAILANSSWLVDSSYTDADASGCRQACALSSLGYMQPTDGSTFALFSTGVAGVSIVSTNEDNPGDERGSWFSGGRQGYPRDEATLTMTLQVPMFMHYLYYDVQFFSAEYPEYVGTQYNDKLTITVNSPSEGVSNYIVDVNSGYFVLDSNLIPGSGFDIFAQSGNPNDVDWIDTTPRTPGADAGASDLIQIGGLTHPVSPNEQITVTINMKDSGDNLFDSAAFVDNLMFTGYAKTEIMARKTVTDINGEPAESGDTMKYRVTISNTGAADQDNNPGNEFEDILPENVTYVPGSATASLGAISYSAGDNKIIWNGGVPGESSVILEFQVTVDNGLPNGTVISNQGTVFWDSNEDGTNDATELTDDAYVDDGIDQDNDGETDDDDPTDFTVVVFEPPSMLTEDYSDDAPGDNATQTYMGRQWYETSNGKIGSKFEVSSGYYYETSNSYKTKLRSSGGIQYWNYTFDELDGDLNWWEIWFACGDTSESADLLLNFKNKNDQDIAKLKFEYIQAGSNPPNDWLVKLYYSDQGTSWMQLYSDYVGGYLRKSWYKIRVEKNGDNFINYYLNRSGVGLVGSGTGNKLPASFTNFARVEFSSTKNPVVCPMFFWDEHCIGLT